MVDPAFPGFVANLAALGRIADVDVSTFAGYLEALRRRRAFFKIGRMHLNRPRPSDRAHGGLVAPPRSPRSTCASSDGRATGDDAELFRAQMLTEMAAMSVEDGLVMQIHPGSLRDHNPWLVPDLRQGQGRRHSRRRPTMCTR